MLWKKDIIKFRNLKKNCEVLKKIAFDQNKKKEANALVCCIVKAASQLLKDSKWRKRTISELNKTEAIFVKTSNGYKAVWLRRQYTIAATINSSVPEDVVEASRQL